MARGPFACAWLLPCLTACIEIDPSYADSFTSGASTTASPTTSDASSSSGEPSSDASTATPACDCAPLELCEAGACTQPARVLFVNLEGATTTFGNADASQDVQGLYPELAGTWDAYGADAPTREQLLATIAEQWAAYRVVVTDTRPPAPPYLMAVVTATLPPAGFEGVAYIAFPDCGELIAQDVAFVFATPNDGFGPPTHANWVSGAFGRGLGLRYNDAPDDLMGFGDRFVATCYTSADPPCTAHHPELCGSDPMQQSSHGELVELLGARG